MKIQVFITHTFKKVIRKLFFTGLLATIVSCNVTKRVSETEYLLTKNTVEIDGKKNKTETINNLIVQKPNATILKIPVKLHLYNLARPNIDSILQEKVLNNEKKVKRKTKLLSQKQLYQDLKSRKRFNNWLKNNGEAPQIFDSKKAEKSIFNLKQYYFNKGWFDVETTFEEDKDSAKKVELTYKVNRKQPYLIDSITQTIKTPSIDSIYQNTKSRSYIKAGEQYRLSNIAKERTRINEQLRNLGYYHFGEEYINFEADVIDKNHKVDLEMIITNQNISTLDSSYTKPFKPYKIKSVSILTDNTFENLNRPILDSISYKGFNFYSYDKLKYRPKAIADAVFITPNGLYKDLERKRTLRYLTELNLFRYPTIEYIENEQDSTLSALILLSPKKKYNLNFDVNVSQSNIQTVGFSFSTGLTIRNLFRGAETLDISGIGTIGASKDRANDEDVFFDINEFGANVRLRIPRLFFPINTSKVIPKYMSPNTSISVAATTQRNIGLDKQTLSSIFAYNWKPSSTVQNTVELLNVQFVKNLNIGRFFREYNNSFSRLNTIAQFSGYIPNNANLSIPEQADTFIADVLAGNTSITPNSEDFINVSNINERKDRLTENNLIFSSSFDYVKDKRESILDNNFSIFKFRFELAGNMLQALSKLTGSQADQDGKYNIFDVNFSQYFKTELDYIKYWDLGRKNVLALRSYLGVAIPYGNSESIPFVESFFGGGPNDNRAWTAYNLGPGSLVNFNEFNEANLKLHFSVEQRFNIFGKLRGALFIDAGNIWNVLDNVTEPASTFTSFSDLKDIAVGSGFGTRLDFDYFVLRFDIGFKTYNPAYDLGNRWFRDYNFSRAVYNIGINYPF